MANAELEKQYTQALFRLLPPGPIWNAQPSSNFYNFMRAFGGALADLHERAEELVDESVPSNATETLNTRVREANVPFCEDIDEFTNSELRKFVEFIWRFRGGTIISYFQAVADYFELGATVIDLRGPFRAGFSSAGEVCASGFTAPNASGGEIHHVWQIVPSEDIIIDEFQASQNRAGDPLRVFGGLLLRCIFNRIKPAHTKILFYPEEIV